MKEININTIEGFRIGHAQNNDAVTGCTTIISEAGAIAGVDVRGGAPGTRETDVLHPENLVEEAHAVFLTGGSAYGLDVGSGIMKFLEEKNVGFDVQVAKVPIVTGAVLFDLVIGDASIRPDSDMGYQACVNAYEASEVEEGNAGAGIGATVGKCLGPDYAMKGGLGVYAIQVGDLKVGAIVAVNGFGDIIDPSNNTIIAGVYDKENNQFLNSEEQMLLQMEHAYKTNRFAGNTTIGSIITNAKLTKAQATKISSMAHDGLARTMRPSHTMIDGDTLFTMSSNQVEVDLNILGFLAATVTEKAILRGVKHASSIYGIPSFTSSELNS